MKQIQFLLFLTGLMACSDRSSRDEQTQQTDKTDSAYVWTKLLDSADWKKNYNFQMFSIKDTLWTFHPDGNWYSVDGVKWTKSPLPNVIYNLAFLDYIQFKDAIYGLGHFEGNIEQFTLKPEIYRTTDLRQWTTISSNSNLPQRFFYHPFVFKDKIWFIGGEDKITAYADIWNSDDGIVWKKQKDSLPFGKEGRSQVVYLNEKLYLLGNDVWSSTDGLNWQIETPEIVKGEKLFGYTPIVFDNKIWLLGCSRNGTFSSQVLVSADAKNWERQNAPWTPRGGIAATVHNGKIYMTGGKYGGTTGMPDFRYSNDVWTLSKK